MAVQSAVVVFQTRTGTGVQTVSFTDRHGNPFIPTVILFQAGDGGLNVINYQDSLNNAFIDDRGWSTATQGSSLGGGSIGRFGIRNLSGGAGERYSLLDYQADIFFGGNFQGYAYVSAVRSGEFDLTFNLQNRGGWYGMATCLGGTDFNVDVSAAIQNGTRSCASTPAAVLSLNTWPFFDTLSVVTGAGDISGGYGWDAKDSGRGQAAYIMSGQSGEQNWGGIRTDTCAAQIGNTGAWTTDAAFVSAWGANDITFSGAPGSTNLVAMIFSGTTLKATAGTFDQPIATGLQTINLGIDARWVKLCCEGYATNATPGAIKTDHSVGWLDGVNQACFWAGESADGVQIPLNGARYLSNNSIVRSALANGASTTFQAVAEFVSLNQTTGELVLNWTSVDSTPRQVIWLALGTTLPPQTVVRMTQLPLEAAYGYPLIQSIQNGTARLWNTPAPTPSRRGR